MLILSILLSIINLQNPANSAVRKTRPKSPPIPKGAKILTTKGKVDNTPKCVHNLNAGNIFKIIRYEAKVTVNDTTFNIKRKISLKPTTAWKKNCVHFIKIGFGLTKSLKKGEAEIFFSSPPGTLKKKTLVEFIAGKKVKGALEKVTGLIGTALKLPPLSGNPTDRILIFQLNQRNIPLPSPSEDELRPLVLPLSRLFSFIPHDKLKIDLDFQFNSPWKYQGGSIPDETTLNNMVSWKLKKFPESDVQVLFSDFDIVDKQPKDKKENKSEPPQILLLLVMATMAVASVGILIFVMKKRKQSKDKDPTD